MSSLLLFNRVYKLEIQSVMLVCSTPLANCCPSSFSLSSPTPPLLPKENVHTVYRNSDSVWLWGGGLVLSCVVDHILQGLTSEFNTLFLTRVRTSKIAAPTQTKTPVKTTFRDWWLYSSFVHAWLRPYSRRLAESDRNQRFGGRMVPEQYTYFVL